jgi:hypothetical protein
MDAITLKMHTWATRVTLAVVLLAVLSLVSPTSGAMPEARYAPPAKEPWRATKRAANVTEWESTSIRTNKVTGRLLIQTNRFTELGAGINRRVGTNFVAANSSFTITVNGAEALGTVNQVEVPTDIWSGDGIKFTKRNGQHLTFQPLGVGYRDPLDGTRVVLYALTNSIGWLTASNEVVYSNCLTGLRASIRVRNFPWGIEQDLILHEQPPEPMALGLSADSRLEMFTEQIGGDSPTVRPKFIHQERDPAKLASLVEPHFIDSELNFNGVKMAVGRAFGTGHGTNKSSRLSTPVGKSFENIENRRIIVEAVAHRRAKPALNQLPASTNIFGITNAAILSSSNHLLAALVRRSPVLPMVAQNRPAKTDRMASIRKTDQLAFVETNQLFLALEVSGQTPAFVLDYQLVDADENGEVDFRFKGDSTYLISSFISMAGTTTIEGGSVLKFAQNTGLNIQPGGTLLCDTTNWLPAVLTTMDDHSVGETISGDPGGAWPLDVVAIHFDSGTHELRNLRFTHITCPIWCDYETTITARNLQMIDTFNPFFFMSTSTLNVYNLLSRDFCFLYGGDAVTFRGEHITAHRGYEFGSLWSPGSSSAIVKNSLLVAIETPLNVGTYSEASTATLASDAGVFQTVEGGAYYLPLRSPHRDVGTTHIDPVLKKSFSDFTTYAPTVLTGTIETDVSLVPFLPRDTDIPDRGYHYPVVDYVTKEWVLHHSTVSIHGGTVVAGAPGSTTISLSPGKIVSVGNPSRMNRILRLNQVQENVVARTGFLISSGPVDQFKPELTLRFSEISSLAGEDLMLYMGYDFGLQACHNSFLNGRIQVTMYGGFQQAVGFTNNCFRSVGLGFDAFSDSYLYFHNNLFKDGTFNLSNGNVKWKLYYNVFDHATISVDESAFVADQNAYAGLTHALREDSYFDLTSLSYAAGPLGRFYLTEPSLRDVGSDFAGTLGLAHFTTRLDQQKESNSYVDYGFHYVAASTQPDGSVVLVDTDGDSLADYAEDANGNGMLDSGETDIANIASIGGNHDSVFADTENPAIHITSGLPGTVIRPLFQLEGHSEKPLQAIGYTLFTNNVLMDEGVGLVLRQHYDTNQNRFTTNWFQVFDLRLVLGTNELVLAVTNYAGRQTTTRLTYVLDYTEVTGAPSLLAQWPMNNMSIGSANVTWRGIVDDPSAEVYAVLTKSDGSQSRFNAQMERDGTVWLDDLPLPEAANSYAMYIKNAAGFVNVHSVVMKKNAVSATMQSVGSDLYAHKTTVSGTISVPGYAIWVNGVRAHIYNPQTGYWEAVDVPVSKGGMATFHGVAIPDTENGGNGTPPEAGYSPNNLYAPNPTSPGMIWLPPLQREKPSRIRVSAFDETYQHEPQFERCVISGAYDSQRRETHWVEGEGGERTMRQTIYDCPDPDQLVKEETEWDEQDMARHRYQFDNAAWSAWQDVQTPTPRVPYEHCDIDYYTQFISDPGPTRSQRRAETRIVLETGGRAFFSQHNLYTITASAYRANNDDSPGSAISYDKIQIAGIRLGANNKLYLSLPDNTSYDLTPVVSGQWFTAPFAPPDTPPQQVSHYHYNVDHSKHRLKLTANGQDCTTPWYFARPSFIAGQYVTFSSEWDQNQAPLDLTGTLAHRWSLGGNFRNAETTPVASESPNYFVDPVKLSQQPCTGNWWISGGAGYPENQTVTLNKTVTFNNGQRLVITQVGSIGVSRPPVSITSSKGSVTVDGNYRGGDCVPLAGIHYGVPYDCPTGLPGVKFDYSLPGTPQGAFKWVQVIKSFAYRYQENDALGRWKIWKDEQILDVASGSGSDGYPQGTGRTWMEDSPGIGFSRFGDTGCWIARELHATATFETTLEFKPTGGHWVPLKKLDWSWSGEAFLNTVNCNGSASDWALSNPGQPDPVLSDSQEYPKWLKIYSSQIKLNPPYVYEN